MQQASVQFPVSAGGGRHSGYHHSDLSPKPSVWVAISKDIPTHMRVMIRPTRGFLVMYICARYCGSRSVYCVDQYIWIMYKHN
jgi:hypothetical protein